MKYLFYAILLLVSVLCFLQEPQIIDNQAQEKSFSDTSDSREKTYLINGIGDSWEVTNVKVHVTEGKVTILDGSYTVSKPYAYWDLSIYQVHPETANTIVLYNTSCSLVDGVTITHGITMPTLDKKHVSPDNAIIGTVFITEKEPGPSVEIPLTIEEIKSQPN